MDGINEFLANVGALARAFFATVLALLADAAELARPLVERFAAAVGPTLSATAAFWRKWAAASASRPPLASVAALLPPAAAKWLLALPTTAWQKSVTALVPKVLAPTAALLLAQVRAFFPSLTARDARGLADAATLVLAAMAASVLIPRAVGAVYWLLETALLVVARALCWLTGRKAPADDGEDAADDAAAPRAADPAVPQLPRRE